MSLSQLADFSAFLANLYSQSSKDYPFVALLETIRGVLWYDVGCFHELVPGELDRVFSVPNGISQERFQPSSSSLRSNHSAALKLRAEIAPCCDGRNGAVFHSIFAGDRISYQLSFSVDDAIPAIGCAVNRIGGDFSSEERALFVLLQPHVIQFYRTHRRLACMQRFRAFFERPEIEQRPQAIEQRRNSDSAPLCRLGLTPREAEVLLWISRGKSNGEIAVILNISCGTARKHVEHVLEKLSVENRTSAASVAVEHLHADWETRASA
jgi:DNA-binding CsgD family transcriptional regulator